MKQPCSKTKLVSMTKQAQTLNIKTLSLLALCLVISSATASGLDYPNRYGGMAESMMDMMDAFSSAYEKRKGGSASGFNMPQSGFGGMSSFSPSMSPMMAPSMSPFGNYGMPSYMNPGAMNPGAMNPGAMPFNSFGGFPGSSPWNSMQQFNQFRQFNTPPSITQRLDGEWQGQAGDMLTIHNGRFRIYRDRGNFREGRIHIENEQMLSMQEPENDLILRFEYAEKDGQLVLRDESGNLMLYRRINR